MGGCFKVGKGVLCMVCLHGRLATWYRFCLSSIHTAQTGLCVRISTVQELINTMRYFAVYGNPLWLYLSGVVVKFCQDR